MPHAKPEHAERNARISELWQCGMSQHSIAKQTGISRNVVIGYIARHERPRPKNDVDRQIPTGCLHITGDPRIAGWWYCQAAPTPGKCWCPAHDALCHKPAEPLRVGAE